MAKKKAKKPALQDATLRNVRASQKRDASLAARIAALEVLTRTLESELSEVKDLVTRIALGPDTVD